MRKSISFKIVIMFVALTLSVIIFIGTMMTTGTNNFYRQDFISLMENVLSTSMKNQLEGSIADGATFDNIYDSIDAYGVQLGIDSFRNFYVLDGKTGKSLRGSNKELAQSLETSSNIIAAMTGRIGNESQTKYMDYALPINGTDGTVQYIIYVKDSKEEPNTILSEIFGIMFQSLLIGIIISVLFGIILSKTIISPITSLTNKAKKISAGDFGSTIDVKSEDEIGRLTETFNDMSYELAQTLTAIQGENDKLETIFRYMTDGVVAFDDRGELIHINPAARKMLSIPEGEQVVFETIFKKDEISFGQVAFLSHGSTMEIILDRDGKEIKAYLATLSTDGKSGGVVSVLQDITEQRKLETSRREFVANVSHELRTPLTTVKSYAETLKDFLDDDFDKEQFMNFLSVIEGESDRMARLVKDLLILSKLDYGKSQLRRERFNMSRLLADVIKKIKISADNKKQILTYEPTNTIPDFEGDKDRIEQVLVNIISNAIKYTPEGGEILVTSMCVYDTAYIKVKDTGIGIPKKDLSHIFERFYRVDKARARAQGGTGLGLAIAKEIVEAHDGTIEINSVFTKGTEVIIKLPIPKEQNPPI